jgi:hypothetical protein
MVREVGFCTKSNVDFVQNIPLTNFYKDTILLT